MSRPSKASKRRRARGRSHLVLYLSFLALRRGFADAFPSYAGGQAAEEDEHAELLVQMQDEHDVEVDTEADVDISGFERRRRMRNQRHQKGLRSLGDKERADATSDWTPLLSNLASASPEEASQRQASNVNCFMFLSQENFDRGTFVIDKPCTYILSEDITFAPNSVQHLAPSRLTPDDVTQCCKPKPYQLSSFDPPGPYSAAAYGLGFFAAIAIAADDVTLDLNGHVLEQSSEHALMQRFYSNVETCSAPFVRGQGPHDFGTAVECAKNLVVKNGVIGRSSHHGIHGNGNANVLLEDIEFRDFEVAAMALNGVDGLIVRNCRATGSRTDIPVLSSYSASLNILKFVEGLDSSNSDTTLTIGNTGQVLTPADVHEDLSESIRNVYVDVLHGETGFIDPTRHPKEYGIYDNPTRVGEGNAYGFALNHIGVAVHGFPFAHNPGDKFSPIPSQNVQFDRVVVENLQASVLEVVGLEVPTNPGAMMNDAVGAVLQLKNVRPDNGLPCTVTTLDDFNEAMYIGNPAANAQLMVSKAYLKGEIGDSAKRTSINADVIEWAESGASLSSLLDKLDPHGPGFVCNGDAMAHVQKGVIGFKMDGTQNLIMTKCEANKILNLGSAGSQACGNYQYSIAKSSSPGYGGSNCRGYSFAGSIDAQIRRCAAREISSLGGGMAIAYDVHTDSQRIRMYRCGERDVSSTGEWNDLCPPDALGVRLGEETRYNKIYGACHMSDGPPFAPNGAGEELMDEGHRNKVVDLRAGERGCPFMMREAAAQ